MPTSITTQHIDSTYTLQVARSCIACTMVFNKKLVAAVFFTLPLLLISCSKFRGHELKGSSRFLGITY